MRSWRSTRDEAALVDGDAGLVGVERAAVGSAPDGHEDAVEGLILAVGEGDPQAALGGFDGRHLRAQQDPVVAVLDAVVQRTHQVGVGARDQLVHHLDDRDLGAERVVHGRHLEADDAAADDEEPPGHVVGSERAGRVDDARIVREERQLHRARAGGDDAAVEADLATIDGDRLGAGELARLRSRPRPCAAWPLWQARP